MFWGGNKNVYLNLQNEVILVNQISDSIIIFLSFIALLIFNNKKTTFMQANNSCPNRKH